MEKSLYVVASQQNSSSSSAVPKNGPRFCTCVLSNLGKVPLVLLFALSDEVQENIDSRRLGVNRVREQQKF